MKNNYISQIEENIYRLQKQKDDRSFLIDRKQLQLDDEEDDAPPKAKAPVENESKAYK